MKKWNKPELAVVEIKETAVPSWSQYEKNGFCRSLNTQCPVDNNGYGKCKECIYNQSTNPSPTAIPTPTGIPTNSENILS